MSHDNKQSRPDVEHTNTVLTWMNLIQAWIRNYIHYKAWDEIPYSFLNFNGAVVEVWEWISNLIPYFILYRACDHYSRLIHVNKWEGEYITATTPRLIFVNKRGYITITTPVDANHNLLKTRITKVIPISCNIAQIIRRQRRLPLLAPLLAIWINFNYSMDK